MPLADVHGLFANPCVDEKRDIGQSGRQPVQPANCLVVITEKSFLCLPPNTNTA